MPNKKLSEMSDAELRASHAVIKNKNAMRSAQTKSNNTEILKQINKLRGGSGGGGLFGNKQR